MPEPLPAALAEVRAKLLAPGLVRAVAAGRRRGHRPSVVRADLRPVMLKWGPALQVVTSDGQRPTTRNVTGDDAGAAVDARLAAPLGNRRVGSASGPREVRVTQSGAPPGLRGAPVAAPAATGHDRAPAHLLAPDDPLFTAVGADAAKRRQVDAFLRALDATLPAGGLPHPLHVADLGCGNAYLTFGAYRWLTGVRGLDVRLVGVDVRDDQRARNTALAAKLGWDAHIRFLASTI